MLRGTNVARKAAIAAFSLLLLVGCSEEPGTGPSTTDMKVERARVAAQLKKRGAKKMAVASKAAAQSPEGSSEGSFASVGANYTYDEDGRRNPFQQFRVKTAITTTRGGGPLEQFELEQLNVIALVWRGDEARALVADPSRTTYTIRVGSRMGKNDGRVIHIGDNIVLVKETYVDYAGEESTKDVELRIRRSQGG